MNGRRPASFYYLDDVWQEKSGHRGKRGSST